MKRIILKNISIKNFKCYKELNIALDEKMNTLKGCTGIGKTTIKDAFLWCLGVDCDFAPKIDDFIVKDIETSVEITLGTDDVEYKLLRINTQKWKLNEETQQYEFIGNDSKMFVDGNKMLAKDYKTQLANIFGVNDVKILLDLGGFNNDNGAKWTWKERRAVLFKLLKIDEITKNLATDIRFTIIQDYLTKGYDELAIPKMINTELKTIAQTLSNKKFMLDANTKKIDEISKIDFNALENEKSMLDEELTYLQKEVVNQTMSIQSQIFTCEQGIQKSKWELENLNKEIESKQKEVDEVKNTPFVDICPTCNRKFDEDKILTLKTQFELSKMGQIAELVGKVDYLTEERQKVETRIKTQENELQALNGQLGVKNDHKKEFEENISATKAKIEQLIKQIAQKDQINQLKEENELIKKQNLATLNKQAIILNKSKILRQYVEEKIKLANEEVKKVFDSDISFKFYKYNNAGAENEYQPTCECMLNGVVYSNLSQGQKIIADFAVNNGLQKLLNTRIPQFIDNKQDNTFDMPSECQQIELVTCNDTNIQATFINDSYTLGDCDVRG